MQGGGGGGRGGGGRGGGRGGGGGRVGGGRGGGRGKIKVSSCLPTPIPNFPIDSNRKQLSCR